MWLPIFNIAAFRPTPECRLNRLTMSFAHEIALQGTLIAGKNSTLMKKGIPMNKKVTSKDIASKASANLKSSSTGKASKTASASALAQASSPKKQTSAAAATAASKVLRDGRTSASSKSAAASTLAQRGKKRC